MLSTHVLHARSTTKVFIVVAAVAAQASVRVAAGRDGQTGVPGDMPASLRGMGLGMLRMLIPWILLAGALTAIGVRLVLSRPRDRRHSRDRGTSRKNGDCGGLDRPTVRAVPPDAQPACPETPAPDEL